jgi:hypothetical protein
MKKLILFVAVAALSLSACGGGGGGGGGTTTAALKGLAACAAVATEAVICGQALAPDGQTPVTNAEVRIVTSGAQTLALKGLVETSTGKLTPNDSACLTDDTGAFACSGITSGGSQNFQWSGGGLMASWSSDVTVGDVTNVPASDTTATGGSGTFKYAVISGSFDSIEDVLARVLGCGTVTGGALEIGTECPQLELVGFFGTNPNTALTDVLGLAEGTYPTLTEFLTSPNVAEALALFRGVFFNCGCDESLINDAGVLGALQTYVSNGGNVYGSDWAYQYIENAWPEAVEWYGDDTADAARVGGSNAAQTVNVAEAALLTWLRAAGLIADDANTFPVNFNLGSWVVMTDSAASTNEVLTADNLPNGPADVPVAPRTTLPITIDFPSGSGCVFYTSYHNEPADEVGTDEVQSRVLEYLLLNRFGNCN